MPWQGKAESERDNVFNSSLIKILHINDMSIYIFRGEVKISYY